MRSSLLYAASVLATLAATANVPVGQFTRVEVRDGALNLADRNVMGGTAPLKGRRADDIGRVDDLLNRRADPTDGPGKPKTPRAAAPDPVRANRRADPTDGPGKPKTPRAVAPDPVHARDILHPTDGPGKPKTPRAATDKDLLDV